MSIKGLFNQKTVIFKNAESASIDAESIDYMINKAKEQETFLPVIDFTTASNFVKFGSAKEYYLSSIERIYKNYPYDGSESEKLKFTLSSSYLDRWIFNDKYPKSTGYGTLNPSGYGGATLSDGYGLNTTSGDYEYIFIGGGVHVRDLDQHDPAISTETEKLYKRFPSGNKYDAAKEREGVFNFQPTSGSTIEWWMKKSAFSSTDTQKEVILDIWNNEDSSSAAYGRYTIEMSASTDGLDPLRITYQSGTVGVSQQSLASGSFTTSSIADGNWHHYAISTLVRIAGVTPYLDLKLYQDGIVVNEQSIETTLSIGILDGRTDAYIGALYGSPSGSAGQQYAGKLSASVDEFRFWKKRLDSREVYNNWYHPIGGGSNTDNYRKFLGLYYKFNEGITGTSTIDNIVMDYSGRVANGSWTGYGVNSRNTGSCFASASVLTAEPADPIIRYTHPQVTDLVSQMSISGSQFDIQNPSYMFDMVPAWMRDADQIQGEEHLKKLYHVMASYFDTLYAQITALPDLKTKQYFQMEQRPYPFVKELLEGTGLIVPNILVGESILEKFSDRDDNNKKYSNTLEDVKSRIYYNIYNNIKTVFESKGTEKSYRNLLRCFGVDDEIVKLNLYTDNAINYLTDKAKYSSHKTKFLNSNTVLNYSGRVFNTSSLNNAKTFISGSGDEKLEDNLAFTLEADILMPRKKTIDEEGYFPTDFLSSSIMGFHEANPEDSSDFTWYGNDWANLQVHLVRREYESMDAKFVIKNKQGTVFGESAFLKEIYDNERWGLALKVYPSGYPFIGTVATSSNPTYTVEFYGVTQILNEIKQEIRITASIDYTTGSAILCNAKRFYAGCEATNFTGSSVNFNDVKIAACRLWYDKLEDVVIKQHNKDASNYGHSKIWGNPTPYVKGLENVHIPSADVLAFNWDFQLVTGSDSNGTFVVDDFSSGSIGSKFGWIDELILRENRGRGYGYKANSTDVIVNEFIFSQKKELPEISFTSDGVFIKGEEEELFGEDEDINDNIFAFEKSMYQVISEEVFKTFSTVTEYANLFMKPVDRYRESYKRLDYFKEKYFSRVDGDLDFEKFTNYYKFLDSTISTFLQQLHPAMSKFNEGISDMVESHILERPKYQRKFPFLTTRDTISGGRIVGIGEKLYNWRIGHAPNYKSGFTDNDHCLWQKERRERTEVGSSKLDEIKTVIVSEVDDKTINLGTSDRTVYQGLTYALRSFGRQYRFSYEEQKTIHSGINYGHQKHRDYILDHVRPHGPKTATGIPQNVVVVGIGKGSGIIGIDACRDSSDPVVTPEYSRAHLQKAEWNFVGVVGKYADETGTQALSDDVEQLTKIKGHRGFMFNMVSASVSTGYNKLLNDPAYEDSVVLTNLHSDTTTLTNEIPLQSPFTEQHVGGRQFRHIPVNRYNPSLVTSASSNGLLEWSSSATGLDDQYNRPEAFRILIGDHASETVKDGAFGIVGPDYGGPYPDTTRRMAVHYRGDRIKRPINIANINYNSASYVLGNYNNNYEIVNSVGRKDNNLKFRQFADVSSSLPADYGELLPTTTNAMTLVGVAPFMTGNVFGIGTSNLFVDQQRVSAFEIAGQYATASFWVTGAAGTGSYARGSFVISGATVSVFPSGSFQISGSHVPGSSSVGYFRVNVPNSFTVSTGSIVVTASTGVGLKASGSVTLGSLPTYYASSGSLTITGSTIFGTKASGSITFGSMPVQTFSTGSITLNKATTFGMYSSGSMTIGAPAALSESTGSITILDAYHYVTTAVGGFTATGRTTYDNNLYTGSFALQGPPLADTRSFMSFTAKGTTMADGDTLQLTGAAVDKQIEADTVSSYGVLAPTDIITRNYRKAIKHTPSGGGSSLYILVNWTTSTSFSNGVSIAFWFNNTASDTDNTTAFKLMNNNDQRQLIEIDDDIVITQGETGGDTQAITYDVNTATSLGGQWHHYVVIFYVDGSEPKVYVDGSEASSSGYSAWSGGYAGFPNLTRTLLYLSDACAMHDWIFLDKSLSSGEVSELYNSGEWFDYSTATTKNNMIAWFKFGEEKDNYDVGDTFDSDSDEDFPNQITSNTRGLYPPGDLHISFDEETLMTTGLVPTNKNIWDKLKTELNTEFPLWTTTYISGSTEAQFFVTKDAVGNNTATQVETGASFTLKASGGGQVAVASTLLHGDSITVQGTSYTINTTTSGSVHSTPGLINAASYRKALHWKATSTSNAYASNVSYTNPDHATAVSVSFWHKTDTIASGYRYIFEGLTAGDSESIVIAANTNWLAVQINNNQYYYATTTTADVWKHYTVVVVDKTDITEDPVLYVNGVAVSGTPQSAHAGTLGSIGKVYVGDSGKWSSVNYELEGSLQDLVVWNTDLDAEDANILYNSGSYYDITGHSSASYIWDWWELGEESDFSGIASGSNISPSDGVISPVIGRHDLTFQSETDVFVTDGIASAWKTDNTIFGELEASIEITSSFPSGHASYTTSTNTATFKLTASSPSTPSVFSTSDTGFSSLSNLSIIGVDHTSSFNGGATNNDGLQFASPYLNIIVDPDKSHSGNTYAIVGGHYYVYSGGETNADWWENLKNAFNAAKSGVYTATRTNGVFTVTANAAGAAGNTTFGVGANNGPTFSSISTIAGGTDASGSGHLKAFRMRKISDDSVLTVFYSHHSLGAEGGGYTYLQDGVQKTSNSSAYLISSTGSSAGTSGNSHDYWARVTASIADAMPGPSGEQPTFVVIDGTNNAFIQITGAYASASNHDVYFDDVSSGGAYGSYPVTATDAMVGFGKPAGNYLSNKTFSFNTGSAQIFEFVYPWNNYAVSNGAYVPIIGTGTVEHITLSITSAVENHYPYEYNIAASRINITASVTTGSNTAIVDSAELISAKENIQGGSLESGVGHYNTFKLSNPDYGNPFYVRVLQDMSSSSGSPIADGVWKSGVIYYVSSTGSSHAKADGDNTDYWARLKTAFTDGIDVLHIASDGGQWYVSGSDSDSQGVLYFTGSYTESSNHNWVYSVHSADANDWGELPVVSSVDPSGSGQPIDAAYLGHASMSIDSTNYEFVHFYNSFALQNGSNVPVRVTGAQADFISGFSGIIKREQSDYNNLNILSNVINITASLVGSPQNVTITDNAEIIASKVNIQGGSTEQGVGSHKGLQITTSVGQRIITPTKNLGVESGDYIAGLDGVKKDGQTYLVSSSGSVSASNGDNTDFWGRIKDVAAHIVGTDIGQSGSWYVSGSDSDATGAIYFTGSYTQTSSHDWSITAVDAGPNPKTGHPLVSAYDNSDGFGYPGADYVAHASMSLDGTTFEFTYPYNHFALQGGGNTPIRATGSQNTFSLFLTHSIKENTVFDDITIYGNVLSLTSSITGSGPNSANLSNFAYIISNHVNADGGVYEAGVGQYRGMELTASSVVGRFFTLGKNAPRVQYTPIQDGVHINPNNIDVKEYFIASSGSDTRFWQDLTAAMEYHIGTHTGHSGSFTIDNTTDNLPGTFGTYARLNFTGSQQSGSLHNITFNISSDITSSESNDDLAGYLMLRDSDGHHVTSSTGYGRPYINSTLDWPPTPQVLTLGAATWEFVHPWNNYATIGGGANTLRTTGSLAEFVNVLSSSFRDIVQARPYHITGIAAGAPTQINLQGHDTGSIWNGDIGCAGSLLTFNTVVSNLSGGFDQYQILDHNWLLMAHTSSGNFLYRMDNDSNQPALLSASHDFWVGTHNSGSGAKFHISGSFVSGSWYDYTRRPSFVLVRGSTYKFYQTADPGGNSDHPIVFSVVPIENNGFQNVGGTNGWTSGVSYRDGGQARSYAAYEARDPGDNDYVQFEVPHNAPDRLYYGCGNHADMGGTIYVLSGSSSIYVASTGTNEEFWDRLTSSINTNLPRLSFSYSDAAIPDFQVAGDSLPEVSGSDDYQPVSTRAIFMITGATNTSSYDNTHIMAGGVSWSSINHVTGQIRTGGLNFNEWLTINWGTDAQRSGLNDHALKFATSYFDSNGIERNIYSNSTNDDAIKYFAINSTTTASLGSTEWQASSSTIWNTISGALMNTGHYNFKTASYGSHAKRFHVTASWYGTRFNKVWGNPQRAGFTTSSNAIGFFIPAQLNMVDQQITGGLDPNHFNMSSYDEALMEVQSQVIGTKRFRIDTDGWRVDPQGYDNRYVSATHGDHEAFWNELSSSFNTFLTASGYGLPSDRIYSVKYTPETSSGGIGSRALFEITASLTGTLYNAPGFISDTSVNGASVFTINGPILGGTNVIPASVSEERRNIKIREQSMFDGDIRQKTIITSRFSAPGSVETNNEAFLDVYAKEFSVYNALPFRNLLVRGTNPTSTQDGDRIGGSGEATSFRVNSHAGRRETLNTLHSRPAGRAGTDSYHAGAVNASDYDYEASFHKIHRNTLVTPRLSGSADVIKIVERRNNFYYQSHLPASDYHYSWVTSSLGDNYSVRSGNQKVFGYWPKDGILVSNVTTGPSGEVVSATFTSAITFPSASDIIGS